MNENKELISVYSTGEVCSYKDIFFMQYKPSKLQSETYTLFVDKIDETVLNVWTPSKYIWKFKYEGNYNVSHIKETLLNKAASELVTFCDHSTDEKFLRNIKEVIRTMHNKKKMQSVKAILEMNDFSSLEHIRTDEVNKVYLFKGSKSGMSMTHLTIATEPNKLSVYYTTDGLKDNEDNNYKGCLSLVR
jgi:hypothetical protein